MKKSSSRCPHVATIGSISEEDYIQAIQNEECHQCHVHDQHLWLCLREKCLFVGCSSGKEKDEDHSSEHEREKAHPLQLNLKTKRIWCYSCSQEVYLDNDPTFTIPLLNNDFPVVSHSNIIDQCNETNLTTNLVEQRSSIDQSLKSVRQTTKKSFEPKFFDIEHSNSRKECQRGRSGLINLGNTCYMNSALQSLSNCVPLTSYFLEFGPLIGNHLYFSCSSSNSKTNGKLSKSFWKYLESTWIKRSSSRSNEPFNPNSIAIEVRSINPSFRCYTQQDVQEFLRCFMDKLHEEMSIHQTIEQEDLDQSNSTTSDESDYHLSFSNDESEYESCSSEFIENENENENLSKSMTLNKDFTRTDSILSLKNNMKMKMNKTRRRRRRRRRTKDNDHSFQSTDQNKLNSMKSSFSIISSIFDGFIQNEIECLTCYRRSKSKETFQDLSLPIPSREQIEKRKIQIECLFVCLFLLKKKFHSIPMSNGDQTTINLNSNSFDSWFSWFYSLFKNVLTLNYWSTSLTLEDCLQAFFRADQLTGDNMYSCDKCRKLRNGVKYCQVIHLPEVLCIHLKRFRHDSMIYTKINNYVSFPLVDLDMKPFLHQDCRDQVHQYDLFSLIVHYGRAGSGHYVSYCLNPMDNQWYDYDDEHVRQVDSTTVQNSEAYVLFYRKKEKHFTEIYENLRHLLINDQEYLLPFYISRSWINRLFYFAEPGPISNDDVLCQHGGVYPSKWSIVDHLLCPVSEHLWQFLVEKFGRSSPCNVLYPCLKCQLDDERLKCRQRTEKNMFSQFLRLKKETDGIYALNPSWYKSWRNFVLENSSEIPGPIRNESISTTKNGISKLIRRDCHHLQVNESIWKYLHSIYGGGPEIIIRLNSSSNKNSIDDQQQISLINQI